MKTKSSFIERQKRKIQALVITQLLTFLITLALAGWWSYLLSSKSTRIIELERKIDLSENARRIEQEKTQRMLVWESASFLLLLLMSSGILFWLLIRDLRRTRKLEAFFASLTHELKTPLTGIQLQTESLEEQTQNTPATQKLVSRLKEDITRLETHIERILEFIRLEGGAEVHRERIELKPWIESFLRSWLNVYQERIDVKIETKDLAVLADSRALEMIFKNLFENSIKHSGHLPVEVQIQTELTENRVALHYQDQGEGLKIPQERAGELFFKGSASQGTGMGLFIIQNLMEKMKGKVELPKNSSAGFHAILWFEKG